MYAAASRTRADGSHLATLPGQALPRVLYAVAMDGTQKFGSLEEQMLILARAFKAEGSLFLPLFVEASNQERSGLHFFDEEGLPTSELNLWKFSWSKLKRLNRLIGEHGIQLVHWNFYAPINPYMICLALLRPRLRHCFTDHNSRPVPMKPPSDRLKQSFKRLLLRRYSQVWCVSEFINECVAEQGVWSNVATCLHFINTERFRPDAAQREAVRASQACQDRFVVLTVANLIPEKGIDVVIRAVAETPANVVLWIVGQGPGLSALQELTEQMGVANRVKYLGMQTHVQPFMQAADCLVCPSLWAEAAGLANLEALATGLPVIASRIGGIPEYVQDGESGLLFAPGDHGALAMHINLLCGDAERCRLLGENARRIAVERFSVAAKLQDYLALYRRCGQRI